MSSKIIASKAQAKKAKPSDAKNKSPQPKEPPRPASREGTKKSMNVKSSSSKERLSPSQLDELKIIFDMFDQQGNGRVNMQEVAQIMGQLGLDRKNSWIFGIVQELRELTSPVTYEELAGVLGEKFGDVKTKGGLTKVFNLFDTENTGKIDHQKIKTANSLLGQLYEQPQIRQIEHMSNVLAPTEERAQLSNQQFYQVVTRKKYF